MNHTLKSKFILLFVISILLLSGCSINTSPTYTSKNTLDKKITITTLKPKKKIQEKAKTLSNKQNDFQHRHIWKFRDCEENIVHIHRSSNKDHQHRLSGSCQWNIDSKKKYQRLENRPMPKVNVFELQKKLKTKGYYRGPIDGVIGQKTRDALKRFIKSQNY